MFPCEVCLFSIKVIPNMEGMKCRLNYDNPETSSHKSKHEQKLNT